MARYEMMVVKLCKYIKRCSSQKINIVLITALVFFSIILAAKTNAGQDFDSLWYMLKPEHMLVGENSFYDYLGYSAFVFYYPKLVELFFLPISGLGDYSFILIGNIFIYNIFIVLGYKAITILCHFCEEYMKLLFLLVLFSIPALTSVASTAKGDAFGDFLVFASVIFFLEFLEKKNYCDLIYSFLALFLCTGTKLTFLLWGGIVFLIIIVCCVIMFFKHPKSMITLKIQNKKIISVILCNICFVLGIHYRTYKLTGYPLYPVGISLWNKLGFEAKYAIKSVPNPTATLPVEKILQRVYDFLFNPETLSHTVMCWTTNVAIVLGVMVIILVCGKKLRLDFKYRILVVISVIEYAVAVYYMMTKTQPDGNYFFCPISIVCLCCFCLIYNYKKILALKNKFMVTIFLCLLTLNIPLFYTSSWSWIPGINVFTKQIVGDNFSDYKKDDYEFKAKGYYTIAKYIEEYLSDTRILASGYEDKIHGSVENYWSAFSGKWCSDEILGGYDNFKKYVMYANIKGFVLLDDDDTVFREYVLKLTNEYNCDIILKDEKAIFYLISY